MRSIKARFEHSKNDKERKSAGAYIHLAYAVRGQDFNREIIIENFNLLVPKDEYARNERIGLINHLVGLSKNMPEDTEKQMENRF